MSLSAGTLSTYKLYDCLEAIISGDNAFATLTMEGGLFVGSETVTVNSVVSSYVNPFVDSGNNILVGDSNADSAANYIAAMTNGTGEGTLYSSTFNRTDGVTASAITTTKILITSDSKGTGYGYGLSTNTGDIVASHSTLQGGQAVSGIPALLSTVTNYWPVKVEQESSYPALVYSVVSEIPNDDKDGVSGFNGYRVQFDCFANTFVANQTLAAEVKETFDRKTATLYRFTNGYQLELAETFFKGSQEHPYNEEIAVFHTSLDFIFYLKEVAL